MNTLLPFTFTKNRILMSAFFALLASFLFAGNGWRYEKYAESDYVEIENRHKGGNSGAAFDGSVVSTSKQQINNNASFTFSFECPKDIREIRIYTYHQDSGRDDFGMSSIQAKYDGSDTYTTIEGSELPLVQQRADGSKGRVVGTFTNDAGFVACSVSSLKINFGSVDNNYIGLAELEVSAVDSVAEALRADYSANAGVLSATISGAFAEYPEEIYCVRGNTDAGDNYENWSEKVLVGTFSAPGGTISYGPDTAIGNDYRFLRFTTLSRRYGTRLWSMTFEGADVPCAASTIVSRERTNAVASVTLYTPGLVSPAVSVYASIAVKGSALPAPVLIRSGVTENTAFEYVFDGLTPLTEYSYQFKFVNSNGGEFAVNGEFRTNSDTDIANTVYSWDGAASGTWTSARHWIPSSPDCLGYPANTTYATAEVLTPTPVSIDIAENVSTKSLTLSSYTDLTLSGPGKLTVLPDNGYYSSYGTLTVNGNCFNVSGGNGIKLYGDIVLKNAAVYPTSGFVYFNGNPSHLVLENCDIDRSNSRPVCYGGGTAYLALTNSTFRTGGSSEIGTNAKTSLSNSTFYATFDSKKFGGDITLDESYVQLNSNGNNFRKISVKGAGSQLNATGLLTLSGGVEFVVPKNGFTRIPLISTGVLTLNSGDIVKVDATAVKSSSSHTLINAGTLALPGTGFENLDVEVLTRDDCEGSLSVIDSTLVLTIVSHCEDANNWTTPPRLSKVAWGADESPAAIIAEAKFGQIQLEYDGESSVPPTSVGHHTVRVYVPETEDYDEISTLLSFDILEEGQRVGPGYPEVFNVIYSWKGEQGGKWGDPANWIPSVDPSICTGVPSNSTLAAVSIPGGTQVIDVDGQFPIRAISLGDNCDVTFFGTGLVTSTSVNNDQLFLAPSRTIRAKDGSFTTKDAVEMQGGTIITENSTRFPTTSYFHSLNNGKLVFIGCNIERGTRGFCSGTGYYYFTNTVFRMNGDNEFGQNSVITAKDSDLRITHGYPNPRYSGTFNLENSKFWTTGAYKPEPADNTVFNISGTNGLLMAGTDLIWKKGALNVIVPVDGFVNGAVVQAANLTVSNITVSVDWSSYRKPRFPLLSAMSMLSVDVADLQTRFTSTGHKKSILELSDDGKTVWAVAPVSFKLILK